MKFENNLSLDEFFERGIISTRSINVCRSFGLTSLSKIIAFYTENKSFKLLKNCGTKSELELIQICERYSDFVFNTNNSTFIEYESMSDSKKVELLNITSSMVSGLSVRCKNGIRSAVRDINDTDKIIMWIISPSVNLLSLKNIGKKSAKELLDFKNYIEKYITSDNIEGSILN